MSHIIPSIYSCFDLSLIRPKIIISIYTYSDLSIYLSIYLKKNGYVPISFYQFSLDLSLIHSKIIISVYTYSDLSIYLSKKEWICPNMILSIYTRCKFDTSKNLYINLYLS